MKIPRGNAEELLKEPFFNKLPNAVVRIPGKLQRYLNSFGYMCVWKVLRKTWYAACSKPSEKGFPGSSKRLLPLL